ncbi:MAG: sugar ABC transporter substrate-binding protein [Nitriliruptoraceae bacterium]|nr:sugar ABC transporter substrate-binding protein [Nitriliruptoraceae bacterium]
MRPSILRRLALTSVLALALTACGTGGDEPEAEPDTGEDTDTETDTDDDADTDDADAADDDGELSGDISFSTLQLSPDFDEYINGVIASFEEQHPGTSVEWIDIPFEGASERLLADASAGTLADVVNLNPDLAFPLASEGIFVDLDEAASDVRGDYIEGAWDAFRYPGRDGAYGYPWYLSTEVTMYNAALLEEAGLDPDAAPETFEELFSVAREVAANTDARGMHPALENRFVIDLVKLGVEITNDDATGATFNTPEAVAHVEELVSLYEDGAISPDAVTEGHRQEIESYQAGNIALFPTGPNFLNIIEENAPDIAASTRVAPQIVGPAGVTGMSVMGLMVPEGTDNPEVAHAFAQYMTNEANQLAFADEVLIFPSIEAALTDARFTDADEDADFAEAIATAAEQLPNAANLRPVVVDSEVNDAIISNVQSAMLGDMTAQEALDAAEAEVNDILARRAG